MSETTTTVETSEPEPVAESSPVIVVADTGNSDSGSAETEAVIDHEGRVAALEAEVASLRAQVADAQVTAEVAEVIAEAAISEPEPEPDPVVIEDDEPDEPLNNKHPFFRSWDELKG